MNTQVEKMKQRLIKMRQWWQRNLGFVYVTQNGRDWYRCRAWLNQIALGYYGWPHPFTLKMVNGVGVLINPRKWMFSYGQPLNNFRWDYKPHGNVVGRGGYW